MSRRPKEMTTESQVPPPDRLADHKKRTREIVQNRSWVKKYTSNYNFDVIKTKSGKAAKKKPSTS